MLVVTFKKTFCVSRVMNIETENNINLFHILDRQNNKSYPKNEYTYLISDEDYLKCWQNVIIIITHDLSHIFIHLDIPKGYHFE